MAQQIHRLSEEASVGPETGKAWAIEVVNDEAFDIVQVEGLVQPRDEEDLGWLRLGLELTDLGRSHMLERHDQVEDTPQGLTEATGQVSPPSLSPTSAATSK